MKLLSGYFVVLCMLLFGTRSIAQEHRYDPPWNVPPESSVNFTVPGIDNIPDLYGDIVDPQLVVFFAGNQFMCVDELLAAFKKQYPKYERIFVETLPPGILAKQIEGGSLTIGNLRITHQPDVYAAGKARIESMESLLSNVQTYAYNKLAIMVPKGNPGQVETIADLGKENLRIAMPNPAWEGVGRQIVSVYKKVGGETLEKRVMEEKVKSTQTYLTKIHHRESPMRILNGLADAAPVWYSEVRYQQLIGHPVEGIEIPKEDNIKATYMIGLLKNAPRKQAGEDFMKFIVSDVARSIYHKYGFE